MTINIVFMGSPDFALPTLQKLVDHYHVAGVITQPDRPAGRGGKLKPPPVKELALSLGLEVIQPHKLRDPEAVEALHRWNPHMIVVAAFGQILRQNVLDLPRYGCINVHGSLLPRWRGAAPVQAAILAGDAETGITIMKMDAGIDTGDMIAQEKMVISAEDTTGSLMDRLALLGADLLDRTIPGISSDSIPYQKQNPELATHAPQIKKEDGMLDFSQPATILERRVRAFSPWPGAYFQHKGLYIKVHKSSVYPALIDRPGMTGLIEKLPAIGTPDGWLLIHEIQPVGKKVMTGADFLHGYRAWMDADANAGQ